MGLIVSLFESQFVDSSSEPTSRATEADGVKPAMASVPRNPPTYIALPSPYFTAMSITPSPSHRLEDPFASPMLSPPLTFYTAPTSPISSPMNEDTLFFQITSMEVQSPVTQTSLQLSLPSPTQYQSMAAFPSPISPAFPNPCAPPSHQDINQPVQSPSSDTDDTFPSVDAIDLALDEDENMESLNPLEKIYLFSISKATYHRIFICQDLPNLLDLLSPQEAVEYVLPLLHVLSRDQDEAVREALTSGLCSVIWWFLTHCQMTEDDTDSSDPPMSHPAISVDVFTPILGRLLLSPNHVVSASAKSVIVDLLKHIREADRTEKRSGTDINLPFAEDPITHDLSGASVLQEAQSEAPLSVGLFDKEKRSSFEHEILGSLIIGLEHLADTEAGVFEDCESSNDDEDQLRDEGIQEWRGTVNIADDEAMESPVKALPFSPPQKSDNINPYFPVLSGQSEDLRPPYSPTATSSNASSTTASTPSSTPSAAPSSSSTSPDGNTLSVAVEHPVPLLASPPCRLPIPLHTLHSVRPASPSYLSFSASPKPSPGHQITDPFSALPAAFSQRSSSPANQYPRSPSPQVSPLPPGVSHSLYNDETAPLTDAHIADTTPDDQDSQEVEEQAAVKRMASISLMAIATSEGCIEPSSQITLIQPIERFSADPVPWVRRESSFAISALAKTVPDELVHMSLLPLLENLMGDSIPHVRHSSLFALPSVLARLPLKQRQTFALHAVNTLAMDPSDDVRSGLLDSLGEILYTFYSEDGSNDAGPPEELIWMFIGRQPDLRRRDGQQPFDRDKIDKLASFYQDRARPLICAFNFPAVAKSLGPSRWDSILRDMYLRLANNPAFGVRRTLAASVGELARILGPEKAERDLMGVWRDAINGQDEEIRTKTVDCLGVLFGALGPTGRREVLEKVLEVWTAKRWKGWRERETIALTFMTIIESIQSSTKMDVTGHAAALCGLVIQALLDNVSAIREAALHCLPCLWPVIQCQPSILDRFRRDIQSFSQSDASRKRMTYVACLQSLLLPPGNGQALVSLADELSMPLRSLARDSIIGVRIGVARLLGHLYADQSTRNENSTRLIALVMLFSQETSREVMLYVPDLSNSLISSSHGSTSCSTRPGQESVTNSAIFSRPPLCSIGEKCPTEPR
ncbi:ARM repeat-containing protein [Hymenopellis radicata]|nr:ARM repeat-containing protein [Hymenopellis radicata]